MGGAALKIVGGGGPKLPRETLAAAIEAVRQEEANAAAVTAAIARAEQMVVEAEEDLYGARESVGKAKEAQASAMISAASDGKTYTDDGAVRAARLAELDASDRVDGAKAALTAVQARSPVAGYGGRGPVERAKEAAVAAARDVIASEVDVAKMIEAAKPVQMELMRRRGELLALYDRRLVADADRQALIDFLASSVLPAVQGASILWPLAEHMVAIRPVVEGWDTKLATLSTDASVPVIPA